MAREPHRLTQQSRPSVHQLMVVGSQALNRRDRAYGQYLCRQMRRHILLTRRQSYTTLQRSPRSPPRLLDISTLSSSIRTLNRRYRIFVMRQRRLQSGTRHLLHALTNPLQSRQNRQMRRFILAQRRAAAASRPIPAQSGPTPSDVRENEGSDTLEQHSIPSQSSSTSLILREGQNSDRSELYRTRRVRRRNRPTQPVFYDLGQPDQACDHCGAVVWMQERTNKRDTHARPKFSVCCSGGSVQLPLLQEPPPFLKFLMESSERRATIFRQNMRPYNAIFAFTSLGARVDNSINDGRGPYVFRLHGLNYHRIGSLLPMHGQPPRFAQLYFHDSSTEINDRISALTGSPDASDLDESVVAGLAAMLSEYNPYAQAFKTARERFQTQSLADVRLRLIGTRERDSRQHNLPTASEVAAVIVGNEPHRGHHRDVIVENRALGFQRISEDHPCFMPMQYPLLFPHGEDGYMPGILARNAVATSVDDDTITYREFLAFRLHYRPNEWSVLMRAGRLFQQYVVDSMMCLEAKRLNWYMNHQGTLRSEVYQHCVDSVVAGDTDAASIGRRIILPSSFTGGPRYMIQSYQDALAICRWAGPPDYFITFTCNPKWPEFQRYASLMDRVNPQDMSVAIARVFKLKSERLMKVLMEEQLFGQVIAAINVVEFQKRGLPHVHILLFMHPADKPNCPADIDKVISAEIPDKDVEPDLYELVSECMIHGPCGPGCLRDGRCSRNFPKKSAEETTIEENGSASYRRRRNASVIVKNGVTIDNSWVVPYNAKLLKEFGAHINVEFVNRGRLVKYLFKYLNKGFDRSNAVVEENLVDSTGIRSVNEIGVYTDCRYMSGPEASYRAMGFDIQYRKPPVERLAFHLENEQSVLFHDEDDLFDVVSNPTVKQTMFTEWMLTNQLYPEARKLTYVEFPMEWVWYADERKWKPRQRGFKIGRIYYAHPLSGERFYMRMLLNIQRGSRTFGEIKTVRGHEYDDCKSACRALGLLEDDNEWRAALTEAAASAGSAQLRHLFVILILFSEVSDSFRLWDENWELFSDDIVRQEMLLSRGGVSTLSQAELQNKVLIEIEKLMNANNRSLREIPAIPFPDMNEAQQTHNRLLCEEQSYDTTTLSAKHHQIYMTLNPEQIATFSAIVDSVLSGSGKIFFLHGGGGTGKTYLWNAIITYLRSIGKIVLPVASSGIAALLFPGGRTAHSRFKIPMTTDENTYCNIGKNTHLAELIRKADLIVWDEAPMSHRHDFETVDRTFRDLLTYDGNDARTKLFGGKTFAFGGDFRQILPVVVRGRRGAIVGASISASYIWDNCEVFHLTSNMRLADSDSEPQSFQGLTYRDWVLAVGEGKITGVSTSESPESNWIPIPADLLIPPTTNNVAAIVTSIYPGLQNAVSNAAYFRERCILAPTNDIVDTINDAVLDIFKGVPKEYLSADSISPDAEYIAGQDVMYPPEVLHQMSVPGLPNHALRLKIGAPIMLLRNINQSRGLCNGTRLIVTRLENNLLEAEIITGNNIGSKELIPRIVMTAAKTNRWHLSLRRVQYPVKLCFAITINKSQGQTLNYVGVYLPKPVFSHGQLYVALSRTTSRAGVKVLLENSDSQLQGKTQNVVFDEIFANL